MGLWATYLVTGAGANLVSWLMLPSSVVSVGASGAVFGLFAVSVLTRVRRDPLTPCYRVLHSIHSTVRLYLHELVVPKNVDPETQMNAGSEHADISLCMLYRALAPHSTSQAPCLPLMCAPCVHSLCTASAAAATAAGDGGGAAAAAAAVGLSFGSTGGSCWKWSSWASL